MKTKLLLVFFIGIILISCNQPQTNIPTLNIEVQQIITDLDHLILDTDGNVWAWGSNTTGLIGDTTLNPSWQPKRIEVLSNIVAMASEAGGNYAADEYGNIWYWGYRLLWEIPFDSIVVVPQKISEVQNVIQINIIGTSIYLLRQDGTLCYLNWDPYGPTRKIVSIEVSSVSEIKQISGYLFLNNNGTLGEIPGYENRSSECGCLNYDTLITDVAYVQNRKNTHSIILKNDGTVWSWGRNSSGVLGNGTYIDNPIPNKIEGIDDIVSISIEGNRCLALDNEGDAWYWGLTDLDLDRDIKECQPTPHLIEDFSDIKMIKAGGGTTSIFIRENGSCWEFDFSSGTCLEVFR